MRKAARANDVAAVLRICDELRDAQLPPLGVQLEDEGAAAAPAHEGAPWVGKWKLRNAADLQRESECGGLRSGVERAANLLPCCCCAVADKARLAEERAAAKAEAAAAAAARLAEKEAKARVDPLTMFRAQVDLYGRFDDVGVPTHDAAGAELPPAVRKRLEKERALQSKLHQTWLKKQQGGGGGGAAAGAGGGEDDGGDAA